MRSLRGRVAVLVVTLLVAVLIGGRAVSDATSELAEARGFARERVLPLIDHMSAVRSALAAESALSTATVARETRTLAALTEQRGATDTVLATTSATLSGEDAAAWDLVATRPPQIEQSLDGLEASLARLRADVDRVATLATPPSAGWTCGSRSTWQTRSRPRSSASCPPQAISCRAPRSARRA